MSHAAEGELHAWLDGALDQLGEERARELREHVRTCALCAQALAEEEGLRAHANEILALSAPAPSDLLPLETLLERARGTAGAEPTVASARPRRLSRAARLGWAASVMVALGAGWMAREMGLRRVTGATEVAEAPRVVEPAAQPLADAVEAGSVAAPTGPAVEIASAPPTSAPAAGTVGSLQGGGAGAGGAASAELAREESRRERSAGADRVALADAVPAESPAAPPPAAPTSFEVETRAPRDAVALGLDEIVVTGGAAPTPPPPSAARPVETAARERVANAARREAPVRQERAAVASASAMAPDPAAGIGIQRARPGTAADVPELFVEGRSTRAATVSWEADLDEARDLIVPGLTLLKVEWNELSPGRPSLRALHELESGETLEVRWIRSGGAAADAASDPLAELRATVPEGWSQVIRVHRDGWLVGRAPIAADALEALMRTAGTR